jgi:hypothetical protein
MVAHRLELHGSSVHGSSSNALTCLPTFSRTMHRWHGLVRPLRDCNFSSSKRGVMTEALSSSLSLQFQIQLTVRNAYAILGVQSEAHSYRRGVCGTRSCPADQAETLLPCCCLGGACGWEKLRLIPIPPFSAALPLCRTISGRLAFIYLCRPCWWSYCRTAQFICSPSPYFIDAWQIYSGTLRRPLCPLKVDHFTPFLITTCRCSATSRYPEDSGSSKELRPIKSGSESSLRSTRNNGPI